MRMILLFTSIFMCLLIGCNNAPKDRVFKIINYRIVESSSGATAHVIFEDDEVTIQEVETTLRNVLDEMLSYNPDIGALFAMLESKLELKNEGGYQLTGPFLMLKPGYMHTNTPKSQDNFIFMDFKDDYFKP